VWRCEAGSERDPASWKADQLITGEQSGHNNTLTHLRPFFVSATEQYFTTMDVGGDLKLWALSQDGKFCLKASLLFGRNLQETTALACIGEGHIMLLTGGYDSKIHVYTISRGQDDKLAY